MCVQDCRTFLWGGTGIPTYDGGGRCFCSCEDDSWSDLNILGRASCVPVMTHRIFGWVGLVLSVAALFHAVYSLFRQVRFNAQRTAAWTSRIEHCRWQLHVASVVVAVFSLIYFALVLGDELPWSFFALGVAQFPINISCCFLATRMWIYAIDRRLMRQCPDLLRISSWLETPVGRYVSCGAISIAPSVGIILAIADRNNLAIRVISVGIVFQAVFITGSFWNGGKSLIRAIETSLQQQKRQRQQQMTMTTTMTTTEGGKGTEQQGGVQDLHGGGSGGGSSVGGGGTEEDESLLAAKKKVKRMTFFAVQTAVGVFSMLLFSICTTYGTAAPLPLFVVPMTFVPLVWDIVNTQLHSGRSKVRGGRFSRRLQHDSSLYSRRSSLMRISLSRRASSIYGALSGKSPILPTEEPA